MAQTPVCTEDSGASEPLTLRGHGCIRPVPWPCMSPHPWWALHAVAFPYVSRGLLFGKHRFSHEAHRLGVGKAPSAAPEVGETERDPDLALGALRRKRPNGVSRAE